jgi:hypothetical protein
LKASYLYYTIIDITLNGGMGGVVPGQKNIVALQAPINPQLATCRHANGRDWWIIAIRDSSDIIYKLLLTPTGVTTPIQQSISVPPTPNLFGQINFSPDGKKMAYIYYDGTWGALNFTLRIFDFNRCSGLFSNTQVLSFPETDVGLGLAFAGNSKFLYISTVKKIIQMNVDTTNIAASIDTVAVYDGYCYPYNFLCTDFWLMYLAANGKIYISSGSSVIDMSYINYPDSSGIACDVKQHAIRTPNYFVRSHVYHPNYYLGCDTTQTTCPCLTGISEPGKHDFKFSLSPNPSSGFIKILYLLPQNRSGVFEVYDITGKKVFTYPLPPWSTLQHFDLGFLEGGVYQCVITSDGSRVSKKFAVIK